MAYQRALEKAWEALSEVRPEEKIFHTGLLSDNYTIDAESRTILSDSCNVSAKEYTAIILLHYLTAKLRSKTLPPQTGIWIDFKELECGEGYYPAFKKRTIDQILRKYGPNPGSIKDVLKRLPGEAADKGDAGVVIHPFKEISILVTLSKADEEFDADANILFDKNISDIFCTEDIVVLTEMVVHTI